MGVTVINITGKNSIKRCIASHTFNKGLAVFLSLCTFCVSDFIYQSADAYETVQAETVIPKTTEPVLPNHVSADKPEFLNSNKNALGQTIVRGGAEKEFYIPNPIDEIILKKIRESNARKEAAQTQVSSEKKNGLTIDSKELEYFDDRGEIEARGNVVITTGDNTVLTSDRAVYDKNANVIKMYGNVCLKRDGNTINGEYMAIDLNEENALIDSPIIGVGTFIRLRAEEGYAYTDRLESVNGSVELAKKIEMRLQTSGFNSYDKMLIQDEIIDFDIKKERLSPYKIKTKEILVESKKDHDTLTLKNADLYYKKLKLVTINSIELFSDKEVNYVEANIPVEIGSISDFGQYAGMGYIFKLPAGGNLKVAPALVYRDEVGIGVLGKLKTKRLNLDAAWATSSENLILDGEYNFTNNLKADFGRHAYKDEWFIGSKRAGHLAQLVYDRQHHIEDLRASFRHRFTAGYASDYVESRQEDNNYGTMRFRWQSQLNKNLFSITNREQDMGLSLGVMGQTMATVYGTGETFGLVRGGPVIESRIKNWKSSVNYAIGGTHGYSPFRFDEYTYGKSSIGIEESLKLCKYLSIGYRGVITPKKDNEDGDLITENRIYAVVGPDDIKVAFSYDSVRQNAYLDFMFLLGTDQTNVAFEKMTIKDPDKLRKKEPFVLGKDLEYRKIKVPENL